MFISLCVSEDWWNCTAFSYRFNWIDDIAHPCTYTNSEHIFYHVCLDDWANQSRYRAGRHLHAAASCRLPVFLEKYACGIITADFRCRIGLIFVRAVYVFLIRQRILNSRGAKTKITGKYFNTILLRHDPMFWF